MPALEAVKEHVSLVVSQPDRPTGRTMWDTPTSVSAAAKNLNLPIAKPEKSRAPEFIERLIERET